jgi:lipopolysaccharide export system protein LptA
MFKSQIPNPKSQIPKLQIKKIWLLLTVCNLVLSAWNFNLFAEENKKVEPIIVNGDQVEYSTDNKEVIATGNVEVNYKGVKLTCQRLTVNTQTKEGVAEGHARLDDQKGTIEGSKIIYNFEKKSGTIIDSEFRANPYFGKAKETDKVSDAEFIARQGYFTTCSFDYPHYRIKSRQVNLFPQDKIQTKGDTFYVSKTPILYLSQYNHSLKDPIMHIGFMPGKSKQWGPYLLTSWRYNLTEHINGRMYLDYRDYLGVAEGFGVNYDESSFGKGDFKYYYTQERDYPRGAGKKSALKRRSDPRAPRVFQRYLIRWRHKWDIDEKTNLTSEYYKITDSKRVLLGTNYNILKDFFPREYELDTQPTSYALLHRSFQYGSMDFLMQKRTNRWYTGYLEKLPEVKYSLPSFEILRTPFYFENESTTGNYNKKNTSTSTPATNDTTPDVHVNRLDTTNKVSLPMRVLIFQLSPFVSSRQTFYDKDANGSTIAPRTIFYTGTDLSTKFYRIFNVNSKFLGMDINGLRHIITPTIAYSYNHEPTILSSRLRQIDGVDSIDSPNNSATLELSNKLQTKREGQSVDLADFRVNSTYVFKPKTGEKRGSSLSDILFDLRLLPFSWMTIDIDATYNHSGSRYAESYKHFSNVNYDINFGLGKDRSFGFGQRYLRKGSNEITYNLKYRLSPKWYFSIYNRYERGHDLTLKRGLREQEYTVYRDLHCWIMEITWNIKRSIGESILLVFRLKAFPEMEFNYNQGYHAPKPGSQSEQ